MPHATAALSSSVSALVLLSALAVEAASAQVALGPDVTVELSGGVQPRVGYGLQEAEDAERLGFGLRRARVQARVTYLGRLGLEYDVDAAPGDVRSVDLFGFFSVSERVHVRAGRLPGAQPRAYIPTSYTRIDAVERAAIAERWAAATIGSSGRDFGADVRYVTDRTELELFVHNGTGEFSREGGNFRESPTAPSVTRGADGVGLAVTAAARHAPAALVEVGAFGGVNTAGGERTALGGVERSYATGGAHAYWGVYPGSRPVRVKLDALAIRYGEVGGEAQASVGVSGFGAARVLGHGEAFARAERYWADVEVAGDTYLTGGLSYSLSAARGRPYREARLTLAYTARAAPDAAGGGVGDAHLVVLQGQFVF